MENLLVYLGKSGALMAVFLLAYHVLLRKETFFQANRWYLLGGLLTAVVLPLITFKKIVWVTPDPEPVYYLPQAAHAEVLPMEPAFEINWLLVALAVYAVGIMGLLVKFGRDFYALRKLLKGKAVQQQAGYKFVDVADNVSPFSYFSYIVYNSEFYSKQELLNIIAHEKVHSNQKHTFDVLFSRIFCIAFWWNPVVWLYNKAIMQNLEFIADSQAAKNIPDLKSYQFTLLKITTQQNCVAITNHFFQSLIKKRIVMLNKNQSNKWQSWKYLIIVPAIAVFMVYFQVKVIAQERPMASVSPTLEPARETIDIVIDKNTSDAQLKDYSERLKKQHDIKLKISKVKRNSKGEIIAIKAEFKDKFGKSGTTLVQGDSPIEPIRFSKDDYGTVGFSKGSSSFATSNRVVYVSQKGTDSEQDDSDQVVNLTDSDSVFGSARSKVVIVTKDGKKREIVTENGAILDFDVNALISDIHIDPDMIAEVSVLTDQYINDVRVEDFLSKKDIKALTKKAMKEARLAMAAAKPEMQRARAEIARARVELERARPEMERARVQIIKSKPEIQRARMEIRKAQEELRKSFSDESTQEMDEARKEIEQARMEIAKAREELQKAREEIAKERSKASGK